MKKRNNNKLNVDIFARELAKERYRRGIVNILEDLNDVERGAYSFTSVFMVISDEKVPKNMSTKDFFIWVGSAAGAGVIGNNCYSALNSLWDRVYSQDSKDISSNHQSSNDIFQQNNNDIKLSHGASTHHSHNNNSSAVNALEDWLSNIFSGHN